ncbi:uncharacterized protein C5orf46 homolog [Tachyglossus aculeatus]|uniref:uncharacterized protein C5orf46 homolog n=1 Tax=Tachyglossus aculeatus TaxID=9261 RepID=UPI0018F2CC56|nr:uncharacterized protein C5orf46 homolog [Tachyglossus aculeatus]
MAPKALRLAIVFGLLALTLPCHADDKPPDAGKEASESLPEILHLLGTRIIESTVDYLLTAMIRRSGRMDLEEKSAEHPTG